MHPENRAGSQMVSPLWRRTRLALGGVASLATVTLVAWAGAAPAQAQSLGLTAHSVSAAAHPSTDDPASWLGDIFGNGKDHHKHNGKTPPPNGGNGNGNGRNGCFEIDTVLQEGGNAFYAATAEGQTFVGEDEGPETNINWRNLSGEPGYPGNACGVSIDIQGPDINVDIITTEGEVFGITCEREMGDEIGDCGSWTDRGADLP